MKCADMTPQEKADFIHNHPEVRDGALGRKVALEELARSYKSFERFYLAMFVLSFLFIVALLFLTMLR